MDRMLRYSERLEIAETGGLAALTFEEVPKSFDRAFLHLVEQASATKHVGDLFDKALQAAVVAHLGVSPKPFETVLHTHAMPLVLDLFELTAEEAERKWRYELSVRSPTGRGLVKRAFSSAAMPDFSTRFNNLADRHRLGYRLEDGQIQRIGSPALAETIVGPALVASQRPGWDQVERSYKEALRHQRGGTDENDDALTASAAALESALKASGLQGSTLGQLSKSFKGSSLAIPQLENVPKLLQDLLERSAAVRNIHGDAHGRAPGDDPDVPQELVDLAIHLTGSFIVYLERASRPI